MERKYAYKHGRRAPRLPAQTVGEEIDRIRVKNGGRLTPKDVVKESKPKDARLHKCFEWKDSVAGNLYREYQARNIINVVVIREVRDEKNVDAQAFVNIIRDEDRKYESVVEVMSDDEARAQLIQRYLDRLVGLQREFRHLKEFARICDAIDDLVTEFATKTA